MKKRFRVVASSSGQRKVVYAADEDESFEDASFDDFDDGEDIDETIDDVAETVEDIQDDLDEVEEDKPHIETDNNIEGHYIAECEKCHEIFISAVIESEQDIDHVTGVCPLCGEHSDQYLKWVIVKKDDRQQDLEESGGMM